MDQKRVKSSRLPNCEVHESDGWQVESAMGVSFGQKTKVEPGTMAHGNGNHARHAREQCYGMLGFSAKVLE